MCWRPMQFHPPCYTENYPLTVWLEGGEAFWREHLPDEEPPGLVPGEHYAVNEEYVSSLPHTQQQARLLYPDLPVLHKF